MDSPYGGNTENAHANLKLYWSWNRKKKQEAFNVVYFCLITQMEQMHQNNREQL